MAENQENEELETVELEEDDSNYEVIEDDDDDSDDPQSGDEELQSYTKDAKKRRSREETERRIRQLTAARKTAEEEAAAAVQYIQQVQAQNEQMKARLQNLDKGYVNEYEGRVNAQEVQAKRALAEAYEAGDYDKVAEAQGAIAQIAIEKERLRNQKAKSARQAQQAPQQRQFQQQPQGTPVRPQRDEKLESWMQKNPWFGPNGDKVMTSAARALHETLVNEEGYDPVADADDYYREIDRRMRQEMPHKFQGNKRVQSVTPASSTSRTVKSGRKRQVELTKGQVKLAKQLGIPLEKYAAEVAKLENRRD